MNKKTLIFVKLLIVVITTSLLISCWPGKGSGPALLWRPEAPVVSLTPPTNITASMGMYPDRIRVEWTEGWWSEASLPDATLDYSKACWIFRCRSPFPDSNYITTGAIETPALVLEDNINSVDSTYTYP